MVSRRILFFLRTPRFFLLFPDEMDSLAVPNYHVDVPQGQLVSPVNLTTMEKKHYFLSLAQTKQAIGTLTANSFVSDATAMNDA